VTLDDDADLVLLTAVLARAGVGIRRLSRESDSLERLFFDLTDDRPAEVAA
jgi:hypothetical protein